MIGNNFKNRGFTLIEILVAASLLVLVLAIISGLFIVALRAQRKYLARQELISQVSHAMEYMTRQIRMVTHEEFSAPCVGISIPVYKISDENDSIKFTTYDGCCLEFKLHNGRILAAKTDQVGSGSFCSLNDCFTEYLTSDDLEVEEFKVDMTEGAVEDPLQPRVIIHIKVRSNEQQEQVIELQSTISAREILK